MNKKAVSIGWHLIGWLIFLVLPVVTLPELIERYATNSCFLINYTVLSAPVIGFFYFNYHFAIPRFYFKQKKVAFITVSIGVILGTLIATIIYFRLFSMNCNATEGTIRELLRATLPRLIIIFIISFAMRLNARIKSIEMEKSKAELALLRTQVNPHFLFNVLNNIYGQAIIKSKHTADSVAKLSDLMRYSLNEANGSTVSLDKEISYLNNYLSLQKLRLTDKTVVEFNVIGNPNTWEVAPMLFIPFIENAFKYGVSNEAKTSIKISLQLEEEALAFSIENDVLSDKVRVAASNQIGIKNVKNRLALIYGNRYHLNIRDGAQQYQVYLKIFA